MAEGRNIEIKIAATGGDPAAAEIGKTADAAQNLKARLPELGAASQTQAVSQELLTDKLKQLGSEHDRVTNKSVTMRMQMQNVGYQVQDVAVQVGSGTSAFRALGQQMPQLLSGFGPVGIALGTISAVALPLAGALFNMAGAVDEVSTASEKAAEETVDLARAQENSLVIERESADRKRELAETLRVVTREQYSYNDSIQRTLDLLKETQGIENEIAAAKGQLAIDKAGDDPVKKAQVTNDVRKEAQARELQQIEARNKVITDLIDRKGAQEVSVGNAGEAAAKNLRDQAGAAGAEALEKEQLEKTRNAFADDKEDFAKNAPKGKFRKEAELAAEQAREDARKAADEAKQARAKEKDLNSAAGGVESGSAAEVKRLQGEAQKLFDELNKNKRDADTKRQLFGIRDEQGGLAEERARKAAKEKQDREKERETDKSDTTAARRAREAGSTARSAEGLIPKNVTDKFRKDFQTVSDGLQNGDQGGEVAKMLSMIESLANEVEKKGNDKDLSRRLDIMEQRIRNLGK